MSENEFLELINKGVRESFQGNSEIITKLLINFISKLYPENMDDVYSLHAALFDYTLCISEIICTAMAKSLSSSGVLDIHSDEK